MNHKKIYYEQQIIKVLICRKCVREKIVTRRLHDLLGSDILVGRENEKKIE